MRDFGSIDGVYRNIGKLKGKQKENLEQFEKQVRMSRKLAEIILDVPLEFNQEDLILTEPDYKHLRDIFLELEFRALAERILPPVTSVAPSPPAFEQGTLFSIGDQTQIKSESVHADIRSTNHLYHLVDNEELVRELVSRLAKQTAFCFRHRNYRT